MTKARNIFGVLLALAIVFFLAELNYARFIHMAGDSAGYVDLIKRVSLFGDMRSQVFAAAYPLFDLTKTAEVFCSNALVSKYENSSFFQWHSYAIVFPIAWVGKIFTNNYAYTAAVANALAAFFTFFGTFLIARKNQMDWMEIVFFLLIMLTFSPLVGSISGQYYFDRLFIPAAIFYFYFYLQRDCKFSWLISIGIIIFAALVSERSALMIGVVAIYLAVWDTKNNPKFRYGTIFFGFAAIAYYVIWAKFIQDSFYADTTSLSVIVSNVKQIFDFQSNISKLTVELLIILLPLIILIAPAKKYIILFAVLLAPNILLNVGGAEKTGYLTHYHSYYIPVLIVGAMMGYVEYKNNVMASRYRYLLLFIVLVFNAMNIHGRLFAVGPTLTHSFSGDVGLLVESSNIRKASDERSIKFNELLSNIKEDNPTISTNEFTMPILVLKGFTHIRMFPIGLYDSDYLLLESAVGDDPANIILPVYGAAKDLKEISNCMFLKLKDKYKEVGAQDIGAIKYRLMKRII
ncbi:hypothetical protein V8G57_18955 [Collimonas sp. H4R21]|uniref:Glycosyltransferase RgtA/B/C/D-like domain-containing protein n=1 Tax=Collimonas rhizosphaerae TaxID=3126357 RepID=A0ABU9PZN9_9BURK